MSNIHYFEVDENGEFHKVEPPKPSKNLVLVVRCKDCEHGIEGTWNYKENRLVHIRCEFGEIHSPDWYCADGVKSVTRDRLTQLLIEQYNGGITHQEGGIL